MAKEWRRCNICEQDFLIEGTTCPNHTGHFLVPTGKPVEEQAQEPLAPNVGMDQQTDEPPSEFPPDSSPDAKVYEPGKEGD